MKAQARKERSNFLRLEKTFHLLRLLAPLQPRGASRSRVCERSQNRLSREEEQCKNEVQQQKTALAFLALVAVNDHPRLLIQNMQHNSVSIPSPKRDVDSELPYLPLRGLLHSQHCAFGHVASDRKLDAIALLELLDKQKSTGEWRRHQESDTLRSRRERSAKNIASDLYHTKHWSQTSRDDCTKLRPRPRTPAQSTRRRER